MFQVGLLISLLLNSGTKGAQPPSQSVILSYSRLLIFSLRKLVLLFRKITLHLIMFLPFQWHPFAMLTLLPNRWGSLLSLMIYLKLLQRREPSQQKRASPFQSSPGCMRMSEVPCSSVEWWIRWITSSLRKYFGVLFIFPILGNGQPVGKSEMIYM